MGQSSSTPSRKPNRDLASSSSGFEKDFKTEYNIIPEKTVTLIRSHLEKGNIKDAASVISDALRDIEQAAIDIAVTGESGAGKSSFINALRGVGPDAEGAAKTGVVETTMETAPYKHPKFPSVTFWDLPGLGTTKFPPHTYLAEMEFQKYDFFFIICGTRFKHTDAQLATAIRKLKKNFYFVRTKVDSELLGAQKAKLGAFNEEETLQEIRAECVKQLSETETNPQVFLVSSYALSDYDFPRLEATLLRELPAHKRYIFMLSLPSITEAAIDRKRDSLKQKVWLEAGKAGLLATAPLVGIFNTYDVEKLKPSLDFYMSQFGLDCESLNTMARELHVPVEILKKNIRSPHLLSVKNAKSLGEQLFNLLEIVSSVTGGPVAGGLYFRKSFYLQCYFLDTVVKDAKYLLQKEEIFKHCAGSEESQSVLCGED